MYAKLQMEPIQEQSSVGCKTQSGLLSVLSFQ